MNKGLISKLENDINCELTKEEIEQLYDLTNEKDRYLLKKYIKERNNIYNDLLQIFTKDQIARTPDEININTLVYVGDLEIKNDMQLSTYNLRYIYGELIIDNECQYLDNLEGVFEYISFGSYNENIKELILAFSNIDNAYMTIKQLDDNGYSYSTICMKKENDELRYLNISDLDFLLSLKYKGSVMLDFKKVFYNFGFSEDEEYNKKIIIELLNKNNYMYVSLPLKYKMDKDISRIVVQQNGLALSYIPKEIECYRELAFLAVQNNYKALNYIPKNIDGYKELALIAVQANPEIIKAVPKDVECYKDIAIEAINKDPWLIICIPNSVDGFEELEKIAQKSLNQLLKPDLPEESIQGDIMKYK